MVINLTATGIIHNQNSWVHYEQDISYKRKHSLGGVLTVSEVWFFIIIVEIITHDPGAVTESYILMHRPEEKKPAFSLYYVISSKFT